jgi:hypothetical protein
MKLTDKKISDEILEMLLGRDAGKTICPSEVARSLFPDNWRDEMEHVRTVAKELVKNGKIVITQAGQEVDPDDFKGAIRLRLK